ncbi:MAG: LSM domain-containing protein [Promethearchaeota archaeon]
MRPLDLLNLNLNREVILLIKKNQRFLGKLGGFDEHLNIYLEDAKCEYFIEESRENKIPKQEHLDDDDDVAVPESVLRKIEEKGLDDDPNISLKKYEEDIGSIVLRGDNIIFLKFVKPIFSRPMPKRRPPQENNYYRRKKYYKTYKKSPQQRRGRPPRGRSYKDGKAAPKKRRDYPNKRNK